MPPQKATSYGALDLSAKKGSTNTSSMRLAVGMVIVAIGFCGAFLATMGPSPARVVSSVNVEKMPLPGDELSDPKQKDCYCAEGQTCKKIDGKPYGKCEVPDALKGDCIGFDYKYAWLNKDTKKWEAHCDITKGRYDCYDFPCINGGFCVDEVDGYKCQCPFGFEGTNCEVNTDECSGKRNGATVKGLDVCDPNAKCTNYGGKAYYSCKCNDGFSGDGYQVDQTKVKYGSVLLSGTNTHHWLDRTTDFKKTQAGCADINDCSPDGAPCTNGAKCIDQWPMCPDGKGGKRTCYPSETGKKDAKLRNGGKVPNGEGVSQTYTCDCAATLPNFRWRNDENKKPEKAPFNPKGPCIDFDECANPADNNCDPNSKCTNTPGSFTCTCNSGWTGDGYTGSPATWGTKEIDPKERKFGKNVPAGYKYSACVDVNDCVKDGPKGADGKATKIPRCEHDGICEEPERLWGTGDFICKCKRGQGDLLVWEGKECEIDVNECSWKTSPDPKVRKRMLPYNFAKCPVDAHCENTPGSWTCTCDNGYVPAGLKGEAGTAYDKGKTAYEKCVDRDDCFDKPCLHGGTCKDMGVGNKKQDYKRFHCTCPLGWKNGESGRKINGRCETDWNECTMGIHKCHDHAQCLNNPGSYTCECEPGYSGDGYVLCSEVNDCYRWYDDPKTDDSKLTEDVNVETRKVSSHNLENRGVCSETNQAASVAADAAACKKVTKLADNKACDAVQKADGTGKACTYKAPTRATCKETATGDDAVEADAAACKAVKKLEDKAACEAVKLSASGDGKACTYTPQTGILADSDKVIKSSKIITIHNANWLDDYALKDEEGAYVHKCGEFDEATRDFNPHGRCLDEGINFFKCICDEGWSDATCDKDIDECARGTDTCPRYAICKNTAGSFDCKCEPGYEPIYPSGIKGRCFETNGSRDTDTKFSDPKDKLACASVTALDDDKACMKVMMNKEPKKTACTYATNNPIRCNDIDDCTTSARCVNGICTDLGVNDFKCTCTEGWEDKLCDLDIDECGRLSHECSPSAQCTDTDGSYNCACNSGFTGNGIGKEGCADVNDCASSPCERGKCTDNGANAYKCECDAGWTDFNCDFDENECMLGEYNCNKEGGRCVNTPGSYFCRCISGYQGDGYTCTDLDDCDPDPCCNPLKLPGPKYACTDIGQNKYQCGPCPGWQGPDCCQDFNECTAKTHNCHPEGGVCSNTPGSFTCRCGPGWFGDGYHCEQCTKCAETKCLESNFGEDTVAVYKASRDWNCGTGPGFCQNPDKIKCNGVDKKTGKHVDRTCMNVNECDPHAFGVDAKTINQCDKNAECTDTVGSYTCRCKVEDDWFGVPQKSFEIRINDEEQEEKSLTEVVTGRKCGKCTECQKGEYMYKDCTPTSDRICKPIIPDGEYAIQTQAGSVKQCLVKWKSARKLFPERYAWGGKTPEETDVAMTKGMKNAPDYCKNPICGVCDWDGVSAAENIKRGAEAAWTLRRLQDDLYLILNRATKDLGWRCLGFQTEGASYPSMLVWEEEEIQGTVAGSWSTSKKGMNADLVPDGYFCGKDSKSDLMTPSGFNVVWNVKPLGCIGDAGARVSQSSTWPRNSAKNREYDYCAKRSAPNQFVIRSLVRGDVGNDNNGVPNSMDYECLYFTKQFSGTETTFPVRVPSEAPSAGMPQVFGGRTADTDQDLDLGCGINPAVVGIKQPKDLAKPSPSMQDLALIKDKSATFSLIPLFDAATAANAAAK